MPLVEAYGKTLEFPDDMSHEDMANVIRKNEHLLNPNYKQPAPEALDYAKGFAAGANKLVSGLGYLAEVAGAEETGKSIREFGDRGAAFWNQKMSPGGKAAAESQVFVDDPESMTGLRLGDNAGRALLMGASQSLPSMFAAALPGVAITKGIQALASLGLAGGAGATIPLLAGTAAPVGTAANVVSRIPSAIGFGAAEGITAGAMNAAEFKSSIESMPEDELSKSPVYIALKATHGSDKARELIANQAASDIFGRTALSTGAIGAVTGGGALGQAYQKATIGAGDGILKSIAKGAGQEALQETPQSGGEKYIENLATRDYLNPDVDVSSEVLSSAASGGAIGAFTGGIFGGGSAINITSDAQSKADRINAERAKLGLDKIVKSETVDQAINAANESVSQKPVDKDDVLRVADPTLADIERLTGLKPSETLQTAQEELQRQSQAAQQNIATGSDIEIVLPDNKTLKARWDVVDADNVKASLKNGVSQPRDRTRAASDVQIQEIANQPDYRRLADSPVMDIGAPVISVDGQIVGGNGRFEALSRAYDQGTHKDYLERLKQDVINKGIDPAILDTMRKPVLVRRISEPFDTRQLAIKSNSGFGLPYSDLELSMLDAERMKGIENLDVLDDGNIALTNKNFLQLKDSLGDYQQEELAAIQQRDGTLSQQGIKRIRNAMLAKAYGDNPVLGKIIESTDSDIKTILGSLTRVAGDVVKARSTAPKESDITPNLLDAINIFSQLKQKGQSVTNYLSQQDAFADQLDPVTENVLLFLDKNSRSQPKITQYIRDVYTKQGAIDTTSPDIFGQEPPKVKDIFAKQTIEEELEKHLKKNGYDFDVRPIDQRDINELDDTKKAQKDIAEKQAKIFNKKIVFVKAKGEFGINGVMVPAIKDTIFINIETPKPFHAVMAHELSHWMEQEHPSIYKDMLGSLKDVIVNEEGYRKKYGITEQDEGLIQKEIAADLMGDNFTDETFWNKVAAANPDKWKEIAKRIIQWLKNAILKAKSRGMGSEEWVTDAKKAQDIIANAVAQYTKQQDAAGRDIKFHKAFHGSPHDHDKFDSSKIGTGEGAQAYGYGHYFADTREIAEYYKRALANPNSLVYASGEPVRVRAGATPEGFTQVILSSNKGDYKKAELEIKSYLGGGVDTDMFYEEALSKLEEYKTAGVKTSGVGGKLYEVELAPEQDEYLLWDKPLSEQSEKVKAALESYLEKEDPAFLKAVNAYDSGETKALKNAGYNIFDYPGAAGAIYQREAVMSSPKKVSKLLHSLGIRGIKYLDGSSRAKGEGAYNYVIFDDKDIEIKAKFSKQEQESKDKEYLQAVESGDIEKAQKMVDAAAKDKGYISGAEYRMMHQAPNREDYNLATIKEAGIVPDDYWTHPHYYQSDATERESFNRVNSAIDRQRRTGRKAGLSVYRAVPKDIKDTNIRNGDWVTPSREYARMEGESIPGGYKIISAIPNIDNLWWDANSINELGYDDGKEYAYKNTKNNRKLIDAVTYDDDDNVIPLSKRFNSRSDDVRFSKQQIPETLTIDGTERPTRNSEGKLIHPTEAGIRNFWKWFGDSKVVDGQGRPKVLYHGTPDMSFDIFNPETYFSESGEIASIYTDAAASSISSKAKQANAPGVYPVYVKMINPFDTRNKKQMDEFNREYYLKYGTGTPLMDSGLPDWNDARDLSEWIYESGKNYDGLLLDEGGLPQIDGSVKSRGISYVPLKGGNAIQSAIGNTGAFSEDSNDIRFSRAPELYSKLEQALESANDKVFSTGSQVKLWLQSNASKLGIKKDEIYWSGINNWLDTQGKVSKQQVVDFVRKNGVKVEDVVLGGARDQAADARNQELSREYNDIVESRRALKDDLENNIISRKEFSDQDKRLAARLADIAKERDEILDSNPDIAETKHNNEKLTLPGGTDYKELVVTVPSVEEYNKSDTTHFGDTGQGKQIGWIRMNTRNGGLFIEELQSQRAQQGRSKGFRLPVSEYKEYQSYLISKYDKEYGQYNYSLGNVISDEERNELYRLREIDKSNKSLPPPAPFISDANNKATNAYITLLMKKAVIEAVSNDHNSVSWTTGDQQADRYDLSKQIGRVTYTADKTLRAYDVTDDRIQVINETLSDDKDLVDYIGKDATEKLLSQPARKDGKRELSGLALKTGGEWAQSMYGDEQGLNAQGKPSLMTQAANDIFKHVGSGKVESINGQPGFYITPEMRNKDLPLFSVREVKPFNPNEDIPETFARKIQRKFQDKFNRFNVVKEYLEKEEGIKISENADVYGAEERYHAKVANQHEDFRSKVRNPLVEKIAKAGFKLDDVEQYLLNRHAQEANAQNRKLTGKSDSTAYGIPDEDAKAYLAKATKELAKLADEVQAITKATQRLRLDNGIENQERIDAMNAAYQYYVPVRGGAEEQAKQQGSGKGLSVKYKPKRRLGHELRNESVIENIFQDYERAVVEVEKNRVGKSLALMAAEIQMPELISINKPEKRKVLRNEKAYGVLVKGELQDVFQTEEAAKQNRQLLVATDKKLTLSDVTIAPITDQRLIYSASPMLADNEVLVYMDGHEVRLQINDELLAQAYKNMGMEPLGSILSVGRAINGWMNKVYTAYNPEFFAVNVLRDFTSGMINLTGEQGIGISAKAIANYPKAFSSLLKYATTGQSDRWIDAYRDNGGNTGAAYLSDLERLGEEVRKEYASYQGVIANLKEKDVANALRAAGRKVFNATIRYMENLNQAGENAFRLATFKAMVESGKSAKESGSMAKNVTVNFNRKGEVGAQMNALYLFFNASIQGTAAASHALFKGRHKYQAWGLAGSMMTLGYIAASMLGGFDDEDEYDSISDFVKSRNLIISYGDGYVKIPVPYGHGFFYNAGRMYAEAQRKDEIGKLPYQLAALATEEFSPFNIAQSEDSSFDSRKVTYGLIPTAIRIPVEIINNYSTFTGRELYPEKAWYKSEPDNEKMFRGTKGTVYDVSAQYLASIGVEISPETLKYLSRTATGGAGAFVDSTVSAAMLKKQGAELDTREIPFVRKFYGEATIQDVRARYNKAKEEAREAYEKFNALRKKNDLVSVRNYLNDKKELIALNSYANKMSDVIKNIRDQQDFIKLSEDFTVAEKRLKIKELEKQEEYYYDLFLNRHKQVKGR